MSFKVEFKLNGAAIDEGREQEISALLGEIAKGVVNGKTHGQVIDSNGNTLGEWEMDYDIAHSEPDEDDDAWNSYEDEWDGTDDDGNDIYTKVHYRWREDHKEWYPAEGLEWDEKAGDYRYKELRKF